MEYIIENDEMFFLCVLAGAEDVLGISNPLEGKEEIELEEKWKNTSLNLLDKKYLLKNENDDLEMSEEIAKITSVIAFPDIVFSVEKIDEQHKENMGYIYIKSYMCIYLTNNESCIIKTYERKKDFISFLKEYLGFIDYDESTEKYALVIKSKILDKAFGYTMKGNIKKGAESISQLGISQSEIENMLNALANNENTIQIKGFKNNEEETDAILSIANTEMGTWMLKLKSTDNYEKASIYKSDAEEMINALMLF